ncbi:Imm42 family immunity protein [Acinetobacter baumannii]|uniref:Imm42 family immunity protein n=1 Tax=Acinetobacter baumannii TaxID=470 RepID=UPI003891DBD2
MKNKLHIENIEMIVKYSDDFFIQWDVVYPLKKDLNLGVFNFWINDKCYPAKGINITLNSIFNILSSNIEEIKALNSYIGDIPIEKIDFCSFDYEKSYYEIILPKGTLLSTLQALTML